MPECSGVWGLSLVVCTWLWMTRVGDGGPENESPQWRWLGYELWIGEWFTGSRNWLKGSPSTVNKAPDVEASEYRK